MDKRRKAYVLPYANMYKVNSMGEMWKEINGEVIKEIKLRPNHIGRIVDNFGNASYINPLNEFSKLEYENGFYGMRYSMGPRFPNYHIDSKANIYNIGVPQTPLHVDGENRVLLRDANGGVTAMNRYKALAIFVFGQLDIGPVHVETEYHRFGEYNGGDEVEDYLNKRKVQIIHPSLMHMNINLLKHYPGYCVSVNNMTGETMVLDCKTGQEVECVREEDFLTLYRMRIPRLVRTETGFRFDGEEDVQLNLEQLKRDPRNGYFNVKLEGWDSRFKTD